MSAPVGTLRFERPPVRGVSLTVYFPPIEGLLLTSLTPLIVDVKKEFPVVKERFAEVPWKFEEADPDTIPVPNDGSFPFPYLTFANGNGQSINFQDDRFRLTWVFSDGPDYPGFEHLSEQLSTQLDRFVQHVRTEVGEELSFSHVAVQYENNLDATVNPLNVALRAHGVEQPEDNDAGSDALDDLTIHASKTYPFDDGTADVYILAQQDKDSTMLGLRSTTRLTEPSQTDWRPLLRNAHDNLLDMFAKVTSPQQKRDWGIIE